jgi:hypothetical protein
MVDIEIFKNFPQEMMLMDIIDIRHCILEEVNGDIESISKQVWEGSRSIFSGLMKWGFLGSIFNNSDCDGIKDILHNWDKENMQTLIFYIPNITIQEIRRKLGGRVNPKIIIDKIENGIAIESKRYIPELYICNLRDDYSDIENIFNISAIKRELDKDSRDNGESIYLIGLKYSLNSRNISFYLNNAPVKSDAGFMLGNSQILKHKLKKGFISVNVYNNDIELNFYNTDTFFSKNYNINENLKYVHFSSERAGNIYLELNRGNNPIILESKSGEKLYFSQQELPNIQKTSTPEPLIERNSLLYMDSFFIPKDRDLKEVSLLLLRKDNRNILAGGQYHSNLSCTILAEVLVNFVGKQIIVKNRSNNDLIFSDFNEFWKLEESSIKNNPTQQGIVTDYTINSTLDVNSNLATGIGDITDMYQDKNDTSTKTIKQNESFNFDINEIEFNDSNVSFDSSGVLIRYTKFNIGKFNKEFIINRMNPLMNSGGTIIDCFIKPISRGKFELGGKIYETHSDILGRAISSKPIILRQLSSGLEIESQLDSRGYILQLSTTSGKYLLGDREKKILIKDYDLKEIKIEIINKKYMKKALLKLGLNFDETIDIPSQSYTIPLST